MAIITFSSKGDFSKASNYFKKLKKISAYHIMEKYAQEGVSALESATPYSTGKTATSWTYEIEETNGSYVVNFLNTNVNKGVNIAIILQLGHGTGTGGYVQGRDYINPAIQPIFDAMAEALWKEVTSL